MNAVEIVKQLGYEQMRVLQELKNKPDSEGSVLCKDADCSFSELFSLGEKGLIDVGMDRLEPKRVHPALTDLGREVLALCESEGIV